MASAADNWLGWGSQDAWLTEHNKMLQQQAGGSVTTPSRYTHSQLNNGNWIANTKEQFWSDAINVSTGAAQGGSQVPGMSGGYSLAGTPTGGTPPPNTPAGGCKGGCTGGMSQAARAFQPPSMPAYEPPPNTPAGGCKGGCTGASQAAQAFQPASMPDYTPKPPPDLTNETGMKAGGAAKTLGDIGKNVFDRKATGLKGLTSGGNSDTDTYAPDTRRKNISELLGINVGDLKKRRGVTV